MSLKIGGLTYEVKAMPAEQLKKLSGRVDEQHLVIQIQDDLCSAVHDSVFLHEIGHIMGQKWTRSKRERELFAEDFEAFMGAILVQNNLLPVGWSRKVRDDLRPKNAQKAHSRGSRATRRGN